MKKMVLLCILLASLNAEWFYKGEPSEGSYILTTNSSGEEKPVKVLSINGLNAVCLDKDGNKITVRVLKNDKKTIVLLAPEKQKPKEKTAQELEQIYKPNFQEKIKTEEESPKAQNNVAQTEQIIVQQPSPTIIKKYYIYEPQRYPKEYYRENFKINNNGVNFEMNYGWTDSPNDLYYKKSRHYKEKRRSKNYSEKVRDYNDLLNLKKQRNSRRPNQKREEYREYKETNRIIQRDNASRILGGMHLNSEPNYNIKGGNLGEIKDGF